MKYVLLLVVIVICVYGSLADKKEYKKFEKAKSTIKRQGFYRSWLIKSFLMIGLPGILIIVLMNKTYLLFHAIWGNSTTLLLQKDFANLPLIGILLGVLGFALIMITETAVVTIIKTRWANNSRTATIGNIQALLPRNAAERRFGALLSIAAGINEELLFRIALPVILISIFSNVQVGLAVSIITFGVVHIYQGIVGVIGAAFMGLVLMTMYLVTGTILVPMLFHALVDINALAIQPYIAEKTLLYSRKRR